MNAHDGCSASLNEGIGKRVLSEIEAPELLEVLRKVEAQGLHETTKRLRSTASAVFRYGIASGACKRDPAADLKGALTSVKATPRPAITDPAGVGELLRAIEGYKNPMVRLALKFLSLNGSEIDTVTGVWSIPAIK